MEDLKEYNLSENELNDLQFANIYTNKGVIKLKLFPESAPNTVANFADLAKKGFYNNLKFHRVIPGFMAQGGCPHGTGTGGPGYRIKCELKGNPVKHLRGTISMAHAGRDTGGSQFFICFVPCPHLDGEHTAFGRIDPKDEASLKVLDSIKQGDTIEKVEILKEEA
ncbi:peptidylprolyl isomerase [Helicobacter sp. 13S00401-1]|uniref:peptidylprolyl isomerase n=1 Tax=Helicobacter sp. 13S00401-1 TaxID=1905758 RepID=UPI000BA77418|nr:peptidylprolyl isomerase [Helicobacter sp. 13S00401-1]PAF49340.1 peptidylprolyl isomerase [Helicobacter sp. 13S00401-1]